MKRVALSIVFLATVGVYAQSFKLYEVFYDEEEIGTEGNEITDGDTILRTCFEQEIDGVRLASCLSGVVVENTSSEDKTVVCLRDILSMIDGAEVYFCWGTCQPTTTSASDLPVEAETKLNLYQFSSHYSAPLHVVDTSYVSYRFYDKLNPADGISVVFMYVTPYGLHTPAYADAANLSVFPNPTKGKLQIASEGMQVNEVAIYDIYGRKIANCPLSNANSIDVSHLSAGVYFLQFINDNKIIGLRKFVKE